MNKAQIRTILESIHREIQSIPPESRVVSVAWSLGITLGVLGVLGLCSSLYRLAAHSDWPSPIRNVVVHRAKSRIVSSTIDSRRQLIAEVDSVGTLTVVDASGRQLYLQRLSPADGFATRIALSPSGKLLAVAGFRAEASGLVNFVAWCHIDGPDLPDAARQLVSFSPYAELLTLQFSADETELICGTAEPNGRGRLATVLLTAGSLQRVDTVAASQVSAMAMNAEGRLIAFATGNADSSGPGEVYLSPAGGTVAQARRILQTNSVVTCAQFSDDGNLLVVGTMTGELVRYDVVQDRTLGKLQRGSLRISAVAFAPGKPDVVFAEADLASSQTVQYSRTTTVSTFAHRIQFWSGHGGTSPVELTRATGDITSLGMIGMPQNLIFVNADTAQVVRLSRSQ